MSQGSQRGSQSPHLGQLVHAPHRRPRQRYEKRLRHLYMWHIYPLKGPYVIPEAAVAPEREVFQILSRSEIRDHRFEITYLESKQIGAA